MNVTDFLLHCAWLAIEVVIGAVVLWLIGVGLSELWGACMGIAASLNPERKDRHHEDREP